MQVLLESPMAKVNQTDKSGQTCLLLAARCVECRKRGMRLLQA